MRALLILLVLAFATPAIASPHPHEDGSGGSGVAVSGDDNLNLSLPEAPWTATTYQAWLICESTPDSEFCDQAREKTRIRFFCKRLPIRWLNLGLVDLPFAGAYC